MLYELIQSLRSTNNETNKTCEQSPTEPKMDSETELIIMSVAVSLVVLLVLMIILTVLCHNTKVKSLDSDSVQRSSGASSPESGFIDDNNLLQVPELYNKDSAKGRRPSIGSAVMVSSFISHSRPKSPANSGRPTGKPQLPELDN